MVVASGKSNKIVYNKVGKDINKVIAHLDRKKSGYFTIRQVGECLMMLKIFNHIYDSGQKAKINRVRMEREELFLMHLWYTLNPYGAITLEARYLKVFLNLVCDPYWDGSQESKEALI